MVSSLTRILCLQIADYVGARAPARKLVREYIVLIVLILGVGSRVHASRDYTSIWTLPPFYFTSSGCLSWSLPPSLLRKRLKEHHGVLTVGYWGLLEHSMYACKGIFRYKGYLHCLAHIRLKTTLKQATRIYWKGSNQYIFPSLPRHIMCDLQKSRSSPGEAQSLLEWW